MPIVCLLTQRSRAHSLPVISFVIAREKLLKSFYFSCYCTKVKGCIQMGQVDAIPFSDSWLLLRAQVRCLRGVYGVWVRVCSFSGRTDFTDLTPALNIYWHTAAMTSVSPTNLFGTRCEMEPSARLPNFDLKRGLFYIFIIDSSIKQTIWLSNSA